MRGEEDRKGVPPPSDFTSQAKEAFRLVMIREAIFGKKLPASTLVAVPALAHPDWLIEVEAIAVI